MADYVVRLNGQDNLTPTINSAEKALKDMSNTANNLNSIEDKFNRIQNSTAPLQKKLKELKNLMADLNIKGDANSPIYNQMAQAAGKYADALSDARSATNRFASDTMNLDAAVSALQGVAAAGSIATGVMGMFGKENEEVTRAILKVQSAMAILNGLQQISNILNKDSVLMQKLKQIRIAATTTSTIQNTTAITANTVAEKANTIATNTNNTSMKAWNMTKAISKALLGDFTGLLIVGAGALATYAICTDNSKESLEEQAEATENARYAIDEYTKSAYNSASNLIAKFELLRLEWKKLNSESEKVEFLKKYKSAIEELGFSIDDLTAAENVFTNNTKAVVQSIVARAMAAGAENKIKDLTNSYLENTDSKTINKKWQEYRQSGRYKIAREEQLLSVSDKYTGKDYISKGEFDKYAEKYGITKEDVALAQGGKGYYLREMARGKIVSHDNPTIARDFASQLKTDFTNEYLTSQESELNAGISAVEGDLNRLKQLQNNLYDSLGVTESTKTNPHTNPTHSPQSNINEVDENSYQYALNKLSEYQEQRKKYINASNEEELKLNQEQIDKWQKIVDERGKAIGINKDEKENLIPVDSLKDLKTRLEKVNEDISLLSPDVSEETKNNLLSQKKELEERIKNLELEFEIKTVINPSYQSRDTAISSQGDFNDKVQSYSNAMTDIQTIQNAFENSLITFEEASGMIETIREQIKELCGEDFEIPIKINYEKQEITDASQSLSETGTVAQKVTAGIGQAAQAFGQLGSAAAKLKEENEGMAKAALIAQAVGQLALSFANAMKGTFTPWDWIAGGISGAAVLTSLVAQLQSFATGGIVGGSSFIGDNMLARVNSGEMILNGKQQENLFNAIDQNRLGGYDSFSNVRFTIDGDVLVGVMNNHNNKMKKIKS